jgi:ABC-type nickel/cobalt efflux system permease component RcnA
MRDTLMAYLGSLQGGVLRTLAAELRADSLGTAAFAFLLGALHALTPGHGKAVLPPNVDRFSALILAAPARSPPYLY